MTTHTANSSVPTNELNAFAAGWMDKLNGKPCAPPDGMAHNLAPEYRLGYGVPRGAGKDVPQPPPPPLPPDTPPLPPEMPESEFQGRVIALAYAAGWSIYHTYDSRRSVAGFPDLLMLHPTHGQLVAKLKSQTGELTPQQSIWLLAFMQAGQQAAIWRPADLASGLIARWLAGAFAGAGQPQPAPPQNVPLKLPPCWNCGKAPLVTLCAACGGGV